VAPARTRGGNEGSCAGPPGVPRRDARGERARGAEGPGHPGGLGPDAGAGAPRRTFRRYPGGGAGVRGRGRFPAADRGAARQVAPHRRPPVPVGVADRCRDCCKKATTRVLARLGESGRYMPRWPRHRVRAGGWIPAEPHAPEWRVNRAPKIALACTCGLSYFSLARGIGCLPSRVASESSMSMYLPPTWGWTLPGGGESHKMPCAGAPNAKCKKAHVFH